MTVRDSGEGIEKRGQESLRAADEDRQWVADRLRAALDQGRLGLAEYDERVGSAYHAQTYAQLNALLDDLPALHPGIVAVPPEAPKRAESPDRPLPTALVILWTIWGAAVGVNLVVWFFAMVAAGHWVYAWPVWVAGPTGAALLSVTIGVQHLRRRR